MFGVLDHRGIEYVKHLHCFFFNIRMANLLLTGHQSWLFLDSSSQSDLKMGLWLLLEATLWCL